MKKIDVVERTYKFVLRVVKLVRTLPKDCKNLKGKIIFHS